MFPSFLPTNVARLTEPESIEFASQIQRIDIATSLISQAIPTSYIRQGNGGIPIVFLHGFDSSIFEFRRIIPIISQHTEVWAIDLLGFGFTERLPDCPFSPPSICTHLAAFWQAIIQQPIILVGVSMGGAAAIEFTPLGNLATKFLSSPQVRQSVSEKAYFDRSFATIDARLCAALHLEMPNWREALIAFTRSGGYGYLLDRLPEIQQAALIMWGKHDRILGTKAAQLFEQNLSNAQLEWIENCGHVPHLEQSQITARSILDFIKVEA
jgi:pimeloyl-ACP methyl ester carboxylesterase